MVTAVSSWAPVSPSLLLNSPRALGRAGQGAWMLQNGSSRRKKLLTHRRPSSARKSQE